MCVLSSFSHVWFFSTLWTKAHKAPLPWDSPGKNIGVDCYAFLQGISSPGVKLCVSCTAGGFFSPLSHLGYNRCSINICWMNNRYCRGGVEAIPYHKIFWLRTKRLFIMNFFQLKIKRMRAFCLLLHSLKFKKKKSLGFSLNVAPLPQEGIFKLRTIVLNFICI